MFKHFRLELKWNDFGSYINRVMDFVRVRSLLVSDVSGEVRIAAITSPDGAARLELSDGEGKSRFKLATLADGTAALAFVDPEEKGRFGGIAKANGFARLSTPLPRNAPSRGNRNRAA